MTADDLAEAWTLGRWAFGGPAEAPPRAMVAIPEVHRWGAYDASGRLLGKVTDHEEHSWWGGRPVPAADVSGVAVAPEARRGGLARRLLTEALAAARDRGAAVSALYPTVSAAYRSLGWAVTGVLGSAVLDTAALPAAREPGVVLRPGTPADRPLVVDLYEQVARGFDGPLTRRGGRWELDPTAEQPLGDGVDLLTVAEEDGRVTGALGYERGRGYGADAALDVSDLLATTPTAARALVDVLAGWRTVTRTVDVPVLLGDAVSQVLPLERATARGAKAFMHRLVDVERAVAARGWPRHVRGAVTLGVVDDVAPWNTGTWRVELDGGAGEATRTTGDADLVVAAGGLALLWTGAAGGRSAAAAGLVSGPGDPAALDLLACGRAPQLLDYF
ncbi:GNAT family N-acetyltransferase [Klenkia sp. LSe6-5]|uniref:GNAT family N-acetyltransferase n=1 Tax=Klenkia sesuvii TaxID=3103137 RepID=A0ABU8E002_9ACTN